MKLTRKAPIELLLLYFQNARKCPLSNNTRKEIKILAQEITRQKKVMQ